MQNAKYFVTLKFDICAHIWNILMFIFVCILDRIAKKSKIFTTSGNFPYLFDTAARPKFLLKPASASNFSLIMF